jgi:hypothetical protein
MNFSESANVGGLSEAEKRISDPVASQLAKPQSAIGNPSVLTLERHCCTTVAAQAAQAPLLRHRPTDLAED